MSGHSKWSTIKHKKAAVDARRGKAFTKILKEITVAARLGGGDPGGNPRLRAALLEARSSNMPNENVDRAIKRGTGELEGVAYEEVTYEGYGPGGVAVLVDTMTDNRNRTVQEVRFLFSKFGGGLGESGSVAWMFEKRGHLVVPAGAMSEDAFMELALDLGAEDVATAGDFEIFTGPEDYLRIKEAIAERGIALESAELAMMPKTTVPVAAGNSKPALRLLEALEEHDDVQQVWANLEITGELVGAD